MVRPLLDEAAVLTFVHDIPGVAAALEVPCDLGDVVCHDLDESLVGPLLCLDCSHFRQLITSRARVHRPR